MADQRTNSWLANFRIYAGTPTGEPCTASLSSPSPSPCCSLPSSSTGATAGTRRDAYPRYLLVDGTAVTLQLNAKGRSSRYRRRGGL